jgi:hypothetical protein
VVSSLQKIDSFVTGAIHQTVFPCDSARPTTGKYILERFGFPSTVERVSQDCLNEIENPDCGGALGFHPESQVLQELRLNTATRSGCRLTGHLFTQCGHGSRFDFSGPCATKRRHETACVAGETQQMCGFH